MLSGPQRDLSSTMLAVSLIVLVATVSGLPDPRTHAGSRHCNLVRKLVADNPAMCFRRVNKKNEFFKGSSEALKGCPLSVD